MTKGAKNAPSGSSGAKTASQLDLLEKSKEQRRRNAEFRSVVFGFADTDSSFYLMPPNEDTQLVIFRLGNEAQARTFAELCNRRASMVIRQGDMVALPRILDDKARGLLKKTDGLELVNESLFDPRGMSIHAWSNEEIRKFLHNERITHQKKSALMKRDELERIVRAHFYGTADDGGVLAEDTTDYLGEKLATIFDELSVLPALRGSGQLKKELVANLKLYRDTLFDRGRKSRIIALRKLLKTVNIDEEDFDGYNEKLAEALSAISE